MKSLAYLKEIRLNTFKTVLRKGKKYFLNIGVNELKASIPDL